MVQGKRLPVVEPDGAGARPVFEKIGVIGLGLIGGSVALAARRAWPKALVIGVDDTLVLEEAMRRHLIDVAADDPVVLAGVDLVVLAAPVEQNVELLDTVVGHVPGDAIVSDVGSTKRAIVEAARRLPPRLRFVGGHPLAGAARAGIRHARADLFNGRPWLLTPDGDGEPDALSRMREFVRGLGAVPQCMDVGAHDRLVASLSQLPQLAVTALMHVIGGRVGREGFGLAGRGLRDTTRVASSPVRAWRDICATNADEIGPALDQFIEVLVTMRGHLADGEGLEEVFESANAWRAVLEEVQSGPAGDA